MSNLLDIPKASSRVTVVSAQSPPRGSPQESIIDAPNVDPITLINLCRKHNNEILSLLELQASREDVSDIIQTSVQNQTVLTRCVTDYGDLKNFDSRAIENLYVSICKCEKKLLQWQKMGALERFISASRTRAKIERLCTNICVQSDIMEKSIKQYLIKQVTVDGSDELFTSLISEIGEGGKDAPSSPLTKSNSNSNLRTSLNQSMELEKKIRDKDTKEQLDNALSIVRDPKQRAELLKLVPYYMVKPLSNPEECASITSPLPGDDSERVFSDFLFARSISTYPRMPDGIRQGEPICDMYTASVYENRTFLAVGDGCGWGSDVREAARKATRMFISFMKAYQDAISNTNDAAALILRGFLAAHKAIIHGKKEEELFSKTGTTTMLSGVVLELLQPEKGFGFAFVYASVGDCKAYLYSAKTQKVSEITKGNRGSRDPKDPGGRLGPWNTDSYGPDLRNLRVECALCEEGDIIVMCSDGVHDNFDPKMGGKTPKEIGLEGDSWDKVTGNQVDDKIHDWSINLVNKLIVKPATAASISRSFIQHATELTFPHRTFMETNIGKAPPNMEQYPGKLDHVTSLSYKIGVKKTWTKADASNSKAPERKPTLESSASKTKIRSAEDTKEYHELLRRDMKDMDSNSNRGLSLKSSLTAVDDSNDGDRVIWDVLFGNETYVVEWAEFVKGIGIAINEDEEQMLRTIIDHARTGSVTRFKFLQFLKGFGPLEHCISNVKKIVSAEYFHGFISSNEARLFLANQTIGTYLIRFSGSQPGAFVLDYVLEHNHVRSVRLMAHPNGGFYAKTSGSDQEVIFKTLNELVQTYTSRNVLRKAFSSSVHKEPWFFGDISSDEANGLLQGKPFGTFLLRFSTNQPGCFAVSFVGADGQVLRGLITPAPEGKWQVSGKGVMFASLADVVKHYQDQNIFTHPLAH